MAAPAACASSAEAAICSGVTGTWRFLATESAEPVTAQVMNTPDAIIVPAYCARGQMEINQIDDMKIPRNLLPATILLLSAAALWAQPAQDPADPVVKNAERFDAKRPIARELQTEVPQGFTVGAVGDLIISRPLSQYAPRMPAFKAVLDLLKGADAMYGNLETTIFDARNFTGAPYSWDGDWTNSSVPAVAADLRSMGFGIVSRANNHSLDWGLEGMH